MLVYNSLPIIQDLLISIRYGQSRKAGQSQKSKFNFKKIIIHFISACLVENIASNDLNFVCKIYRTNSVGIHFTKNELLQIIIIYQCNILRHNNICEPALPNIK